MSRRNLKCCMENCNSISGEGYGEIAMFSFPKVKDVRQRWVQFCGNPNISAKAENGPLYSLTYYRICALHFTAESFTNSSKKRLNRGAIPTIVSSTMVRDDAAGIPGNEISVPSPASYQSCLITSSPIHLIQSPTNPLQATSSHASSCTPLPLFTSTPSHPSRSLLKDFLSVDQSTSNLSSLSPNSPVFVHSSPSPNSLSIIPSSPLTHLSIPIPSSPLPPIPISSSPAMGGLTLSDIKLTRAKELTPRKRILFKYAKSKEKQLKRLQVTVENLKKLLKRSSKSKTSLGQISNLLNSSVSRSAAVLLGSQLKSAGKKPNGRRWTQEEKLLALLLYKRSPKSYRLLRYLFTLPSRSTISTILNSFSFVPGINPQIFASLSHSLGQMEDCDRTCVLMFDEMSIMEHCEYNPSLDLIMGFEDHGHNRRSKTLAKYALVFMVCGVLRKWKQPIAFYFSGSQTKSVVLVPLMEEVLQHCHEAGLNVIATVCDMGANNVKAVRSMGSSIRHPFIKFKDHIIFTLFDSPHLIKSTRNLFVAHDFIIPMEIAGTQLLGTASWSHVEGAYHHAKGALLHRPLNRLTEDHIHPQGRKKMKVKLAAQVMSRSLAVYIEEGYRSGWLPTGALSTSAFIGFMDDLFDSMNGGTQKHPSKPLLSGVSLKSPHFRFWKEAASLVSKWKIVKDFKDGEIIFSSMPPTQKGWLNNLQAFPIFCREILNKPFAAGKCISTRSFNQDPLEGLFGTIRSNCGDNRNPTTTQFISSLKTAILNGLAFSSTVKGCNCEEDDNKLMDSLRTLICADGTDGNDGDPEETGDGFSGFVVTEADEVVSESSGSLLAFVCASLLRKTLRQCSCNDCRKALLGSGNHYTLKVYYREVGDKFACPSKELIEVVTHASQIVEKMLDSNPDMVKVEKTIANIIQDKISFEWMRDSCPLHVDVIKRQFLDAVMRQTILWWCRRLNKR